jgi:hypothetical protein
VTFKSLGEKSRPEGLYLDVGGFDELGDFVSLPIKIFKEIMLSGYDRLPSSFWKTTFVAHL